MLQVMSMYRGVVVVVVVGASLSRIAGEGTARAEVLHGLPGGGPNGGVVSGGIVSERGETGVVGERKDEGLLGEDVEDGGVRGNDGVEQVDGGIANGIVAVDVKKRTGRAVKAAKWHVVGVDCATTGTEDGARSADVRRRGKKQKAHAERHRVFDGGAEGVPAIKDPTWAVEPPAGVLEAGALCPDGLGLLTVVRGRGRR